MSTRRFVSTNASHRMERDAKHDAALRDRRQAARLRRSEKHIEKWSGR